jgi:ABC-2 type transport system ATP-binding protein
LGGRDTATARIRYRVPAGLQPPAHLTGLPDADGFVELRPADVTATLHALTGWALEHGAALDSLQIIRPSLEDVYLALTGGSEGSPR